MKSKLKLDWVAIRAAKYACARWHYSETIPVGKKACIGVWENDVFIGVIIYAHGVTPKLGNPYGLQQHQCIELSRVALKEHIAPVSRIVSISIKLIKRRFKNIKMLISFADPSEGHHGGIYQAMNWFYIGDTTPGIEYEINGKRVHNRQYRGTVFGQPKSKLPSHAIKKKTLGKHRYVLPLHNDMKPLLEKLRLKYPKRVPVEGSGDHPDVGGANPTHTLHLSQDNEVLNASTD
tara:strand:+ start:1778 stop:2479 length:702 start_codon:yes stop_codon:yes gene_type:complete